MLRFAGRRMASERVSDEEQQQCRSFPSQRLGLARPGLTVARPLWAWRIRFGQARHQSERCLGLATCTSLDVFTHLLKSDNNT
jgi:hypothetical protein